MKTSEVIKVKKQLERELNKKIRITFTERELVTMSHIMHHFTDYMSGDNRPDHGFGILKSYKNLSEERKCEIYVLAAKLMRANIKKR